ncbi:high-affinity choline transporter 1-like [Elysia marginata]|uniref:High-affinity choline transporter 1-like n=1 Tax=Elysia marginata TaxID=1093978 RepID=A0AAV4IFA9_9GAST|nr:high-affinity choline transporter 1-like [Elysia marginata]
MLLHIVNKPKYKLKQIELKYFQPNHSFMASDSAHGRNEKQIGKMGKLFDFRDFVQATKAVNLEPVEMSFLDSRNWASGASLYALKQLGEQQPYLHKIVCAKLCKASKALIHKTVFGQTEISVKILSASLHLPAACDWSNTTFGVSPLGTNQSSLILPLVINEFTPGVISLLGLGAISAAVMSSMDSSILGTSSMFTHNIYHEMFRSNASKLELRCVQMFAVVFFGSISMAIAVLSDVIYGIFILAADIVFVIIFPQLTAVLFLPSYVNPAGAVAGFFLGLVLRIGAGEPIIDLPAWIHFPFYSDEEGGQLFPFRTVSMLLSFSAIILVTRLSRWIGRRKQLGSDSCRYKWFMGTGGLNPDPATQDLNGENEVHVTQSNVEDLYKNMKGKNTTITGIKLRNSVEDVEMDSMQNPIC